MEDNQSGHDENTETTHTDSIENLLDDVFGLSPTENDGNETCLKIDKSKQSRLSRNTAPNERRTGNITKLNTRTAANVRTRKVDRKAKTNDVPKTSSTPCVPRKSSVSCTSVLVNPAKTVDKTKGQKEAADSSVTAMLDDIFFGDVGTPTKTRKPPKHKSPRRARRVDKRSDSTDSECIATCDISRNVADRTIDAESLGTCDSDVSDIFSDPQKWVRKDKQHRYDVSKMPDGACSDEEDIYDKLLATGKLQRIKR